MSKKTLVFGASLKSNRYSYLAVERLVNNGIETQAFGLVAGTVSGVEVKTDFHDFQNIHTVTLYINPKRQKEYYDSILGFFPKRVIFNPGTENPEFYKLLTLNNIAYEEACTLVLLGTGQY